MPDHTTPPSTASAAPPAAEASPAEAPRPRRYVETKTPRGVYVRVFIYVVATHVLLALMSLVVVMANSR
ncbi:DUF6126 family protein [Streptomyces sp. NPDC048506]|uniref:DUF6126 family protein n=1 Tax=Streptomyces sp. NPDC048506 TaxID=3155028 RepID=UPI003439B91B